MSMNYLKNYFTIFFLATFLYASESQDLHFSQFETLSPILNPALTGSSVIVGDGAGLRFSSIFRNQWSSVLNKASYKTYGASFDMVNCFPGGDKEGLVWGLGLGFIRDESGIKSVQNIADDRYSFNRNDASLNLSVIIPTPKSMFFSGGLRVRYISSGVQTAGLRFDDQFDGRAGFDSNIAGEFDDIDFLQSDHFDLGGGVSFFYVKDRFALTTGGVVDYAYQNIAYNYLDNNLPERLRKFTLHIKLTAIVLEKDNLNIGANFKFVLQDQKPHQQWVARCDLFFQGNNSFGAFVLGGGIRRSRAVEDTFHQDAFLTNIGLVYQRFKFSFNYDINTSSLNLASNNYGALEFSLIYRWGQNAENRCNPTPSGCDQSIHHAIFY